MNNIAIYARIKPMTDAVGRADYISNPKRQENLLAVSGQLDTEYWEQLSVDSQAAWRANGGARERTVQKQNKKTGEIEIKTVKNRACEAREVHVALPRCVLELSKEQQQEIADNLCRYFANKYGVDCLVGLHLSKTENNVHAHILFSERQRLVKPEIKIADRNVFLSEEGIRKRTKREIMDEAGKLLPGCSIIPKGEIMSARYFGEKETLFSDKAWADLCKKDLVVWINEELKPDKPRIVFDRKGPYLPQVHVGKGHPDEMKIVEYNGLVRVFNRLIDEQTVSGQEAQQIKTLVMLAPRHDVILKSYLAEKAVQNQEVWFSLGNTNLGKMSIEQLKRIADDTAYSAWYKMKNVIGEREKQKQKLCELYRMAAVERKAAREAKAGSLDERVHSSEARKISAEIERMRKKLGYVTEAEIRKRELDEEFYRRMQIEKALHNRKLQRYLERRAEELQEIIEEKEKELEGMKYVVGYYEKKQQLKKQLKELRATQEQLLKDAERAKLDRILAKWEMQYVRARVREEKKAERIESRSREQERS